MDYIPVDGHYNSAGPPVRHAARSHERYDTSNRTIRRDVDVYLNEVAHLVEDLDSGRLEAEEKEIFVDRAFETISKSELAVALHAQHSFAFEKLIAHGTPLQLSHVVQNFSANYTKIFQHRTASRVLEALLKRVGELHWEGMEDCFLVALTELQDKWIRIITSRNGSFCTRTLIAVVWGEANAPALAPQRIIIKLRDTLLATLMQELEARTLCFRDESAHVIQALVASLPDAEDKYNLIYEVLTVAKRTDMVQHRIGSHVLEAILRTIAHDAELLQEIYDKVISSRLVEHALHDSGNFVVKAFLEATKDKDTLKKGVFKKLFPAFDDLMENGRFFLVEGLLRIAQGQLHSELKCVRRIRRALSIERDDDRYSELIRKLLVLQDASSLTEIRKGQLILESHFEHGAVRSVGSRLLQELLKFNAEVSSQIVGSIVEFGNLMLVAIAKESFGAPLLETALELSTQEDRKHIMAQLKSSWASLASNEYGSRVVDAAFRSSRLKDKETIVKEVNGGVEMVLQTQCGSLVARNIRARLYERNPEKWRSAILSKEKAESFLDDIIKDVDAGDTNKKKMKRKRDAIEDLDAAGRATGDGEAKRKKKVKKSSTKGSTSTLDDFVKDLGFPI